ncbi:MAG TPA: HEAT repeat domain-containing protein, partial [Polyangia bacterium]|nr:HEAT repeat domain-containing protein [Polyangia bacterium]
RVREIAVQGLPLMDDPRAFEALLATTKDSAEKTRAAAMRSLGQCADDLRATAYLLKGLGDADSWVRYYACQALGKLAFEPAAQAIVQLLSDPAGQVRVAAIEALSCLNSDAAVKALKAAAADPDADIQRAAIVGLGVAKRAEGLPLILNAVRAPEASTRLVAISALAGFRTAEVLEAYRAAASDPDDSVRTAAVGFLAAMPGAVATKVLVDLLHTLPSTDQVLTALSLNVEGRVAGLVAALQDADDEIAPGITSALTRLRRPDAVAALIKAMTIPNVAARKATAGALATIGSKDALLALRKAASDDPEPQVRQVCSLLLAR